MNSTSAIQTCNGRESVPGRFEIERLEAVRRYAILDTPPEGAFDRITRLAAQIFDVPFALISIVDLDRVWFKSGFGVASSQEVPREHSLCAAAIESYGAYIVENAIQDPRSRQKIAVTGPMGVGFYVGIPLLTSDGYNLGELCVFDNVPHVADPKKVEMLSDLAKIVLDELELRLATRRLVFETSLRQDAQAEAATATRSVLSEISLREDAQAEAATATRSALTDVLTGLGNRRSLESRLDALNAAFRRGEKRAGGLVIFDLDGLKKINDLRGHDAGDRFLRTFGSALTVAFPSQHLFRYGGDEFVMLWDATMHEPDVRAGVADAIRAALDAGFSESDVSFGIAKFGEVAGSPRMALRLADSRMYALKIAHHEFTS